MTQRQTIYPALEADVIRAFADQPVVLDGMNVVFDEKVGLYPARVELTEDPADGPRARPRTQGVITASPATLRSRIDGR
jgi:hypothetical protein